MRGDVTWPVMPTPKYRVTCTTVAVCVQATVCAEQQGEGRFDVACRVNGDELGRETEDTRMLWVMLVPFVLHVRRFLQAWPGLHFKVRLAELLQHSRIVLRRLVWWLFTNLIACSRSSLEPQEAVTEYFRKRRRPLVNGFTNVFCAMV